MTKLLPRLVAIAAATALMPSCIGFQRQWNRAEREPQRGIEGAWTGSWSSSFNGHKGKLRCVVTETAPGTYEFYYWATWARVVSAGFRIECEVEEKGGKWIFSGDKDLGKLGGAFSYEGTVTKGKLKATYKSDRGDTGTFELSRP